MMVQILTLLTPAALAAAHLGANHREASQAVGSAAEPARHLLVTSPNGADATILSVVRDDVSSTVKGRANYAADPLNAAGWARAHARHPPFAADLTGHYEYTGTATASARWHAWAHDDSDCSTSAILSASAGDASSYADSFAFSTSASITTSAAMTTSATISTSVTLPTTAGNTSSTIPSIAYSTSGTLTAHASSDLPTTGLIYETGTPPPPATITPGFSMPPWAYGTGNLGGGSAANSTGIRSNYTATQGLTGNAAAAAATAGSIAVGGVLGAGMLVVGLL